MCLPSFIRAPIVEPLQPLRPSVFRLPGWGKRPVGRADPGGPEQRWEMPWGPLVFAQTQGTHSQKSCRKPQTRGGAPQGAGYGEQGRVQVWVTQVLGHKQRAEPFLLGAVAQAGPVVLLARGSAWFGDVRPLTAQTQTCSAQDTWSPNLATPS